MLRKQDYKEYGKSTGEWLEVSWEENQWHRPDGLMARSSAVVMLEPLLFSLYCNISNRLRPKIQTRDPNYDLEFITSKRGHPHYVLYPSPLHSHRYHTRNSRTLDSPPVWTTFWLNCGRFPFYHWHLSGCTSWILLGVRSNLYHPKNFQSKKSIEDRHRMYSSFWHKKSIEAAHSSKGIGQRQIYIRAGSMDRRSYFTAIWVVKIHPSCNLTSLTKILE